MTRTSKLLIASALAASLAGLGPVSASPGPTPGDVLARAQAQAYPGESYTQYYRRGGYYGRGYRRGGGGAGLAAGLIGGLAAGALIGGAIAGAQAAPPAAYGPPVGAYGPGAPVGNVYGRDPNWVNYCASRYRSFDPVSGTYLASDGYRYPCR